MTDLTSPPALDGGPDYFETYFPRDALPSYGWSSLPSGLPAQAWTTETTHRDGQQGGLPFTAKQSVEVYQILCDFTAQSGAIRQAEFFVYRAQDLSALRAIQEKYAGGAPIEPTTWIRASTTDVALIQKLGIAESGLLASISDYHVFHKFRTAGRRSAASNYLDAVKMTLDAGIRPRLHLEDATRAAPAFLVSFVEAVMKVGSDYPLALCPKFRVCDTLGLGLPYNDVPLPRSVPKLIQELRRIGIKAQDLEFHPHNDTGLVLANSLAAVRAGCSVINGTCLGKGERTGNAPLELILLHLIGMGYFSGKPPNFQALNRLVDLYADLGQPVSEKYPLFGRDAHRTRAGIHADGLNKFWPMYAPFNVPFLIGRPLEVSLTKDSGLAGLIFVVNQQLHRQLDKNDPALQEANHWMMQEFAGGRQTAIEWEEISRFFSGIGDHRAA
jgi:isopropylmalate/homocitrate/citramalate synthase